MSNEMWKSISYSYLGYQEIEKCINCQFSKYDLLKKAYWTV